MHGFRDQLALSIAFAISRSRDLLRRILREHTSDHARKQLAERVVSHLELSGYEVDGVAKALKQKPPARPHG